MAYVTPGKPRFLVDTSGPVETIRIRARRQIFGLLFLPVWLAGWTAGGVAAMAQLVQQFNAFLMFWLCGWALGWVVAAATLGWMLFGSETLRVYERDLEVGLHIGAWSRRKVYQGSLIRNLKAAELMARPFGAFRLNVPFLPGADGGLVKFNYGARTIRVASGLDEAEGRLIADWLAKRLPASASAP